MIASGRRALPATAAVLALLGVGICIDLVEFPAIEAEAPAGWQALPSEEPGNIERASFSYDRYAPYFTLREHTDDPTLIVPEPLGGNGPGRYYGLGDVSRIVVREFDATEVLAALDVDDQVVASGPVADGEARFRLALLNANAEVVVFLKHAGGDIDLVDLRLLPAEIQAQLRR